MKVEEILTITTFPEKDKEINEKEATLDARRATKDPITQGS